MEAEPAVEDDVTGTEEAGAKEAQDDPDVQEVQRAMSAPPEPEPEEDDQPTVISDSDDDKPVSTTPSRKSLEKVVAAASTCYSPEPRRRKMPLEQLRSSRSSSNRSHCSRSPPLVLAVVLASLPSDRITLGRYPARLAGASEDGW